MPATINPETAPNTTAVIDESFRSLFQKLSGHGDALEIEVNHSALIEAAVDSGFGSDNSLLFNFTAQPDHALITVENDSAQKMHCVIHNPSRFLGSKEDAQTAIQGGILNNLIFLSERLHGDYPQELIKRATPPRFERIKRQVKVLGGAAVSAVASDLVIETVASSSPEIVKFGSGYAIAYLAYTGLRDSIRPAQHKDEGVIGGYPPFIDFKINPVEK